MFVSVQTKKIFNMGYAVFLMILAIVYFTVDPRNIFVPILALTLLFGLFNGLLYFREKRTTREPL